MEKPLTKDEWEIYSTSNCIKKYLIDTRRIVKDINEGLKKSKNLKEVIVFSPINFQKYQKFIDQTFGYIIAISNRHLEPGSRYFEYMNSLYEKRYYIDMVARQKADRESFERLAKLDEELKRRAKLEQARKMKKKWYFLWLFR